MTARRVAAAVMAVAAGCGALYVLPAVYAWWGDIGDAVARLRGVGGDPVVMYDEILQAWERQLHARWVEGGRRPSLVDAIDQVASAINEVTALARGDSR